MPTSPTFLSPSEISLPAQPSPATINLAHMLEVLGWSKALGCSEAQLRQAVAEVGPDLQEVCSHLGLPGPGDCPTVPARHRH